MDKVFKWQKVVSSRGVTLPCKASNPSPRDNFVTPHVNGSLQFTKECVKSRLAQGHLGDRVTLPPGTTSPHVNRAKDDVGFTQRFDNVLILNKTFISLLFFC